MPESFRVALDLRGVSHSEGGHRRLINLVRELDALPSPLEFDLISNPCHEIDKHSWSIRTHTISPRLRTRMMHHPGVISPQSAVGKDPDHALPDRRYLVFTHQ
ncbi:MAG: hypothetical protein IPI28_11075 [Candidatus Omnitrophica bacterium]|nr:hypothetical protein [Candidatus Omnitrophota bacterium]